ncbi:stress-related protein [Prunus yedoensis var. nudiflora]|uniref:Stress-related protein n=1 Tax=Prunus yedoensis var. nudiflora TaxID=2094558 RepID=A0A314YDQ0_PRUYE|nr:stress-related protein [Prunus yedoensis var. nudiflora]
MADSEAKQPTETVQVNEKSLKYMEFVQVAAIYVVVCFSSLYEYAKENSGPLKPGVQTVEGTVKTVIGPVYEKFHDLPFQLLKFVDRKVDESLGELDRHVPCLVKQASGQALSVAQKAPEVARTVASEVQRAGLVDTARNLTVSVYAKYEPVAERYAVSAWRSLNGLPLFPQVTQIMVPTVAYWSAKYNQAVGYSADRGYSVAAYLPLIPTERIAKVFDEAENDPAVSTSGGAVAMEQ